MKMDTGKAPAISIGKKSTAIPPLASESSAEEKPSQVAPTKSVNDNTLETLAELLSLIQEDCRRYSETLTPYFPRHLPVFMKFEGDGIIYLAAPPGHILGTDNGHITLDGSPVTGWKDTDNTGKNTDAPLAEILSDTDKK